MNGSLRKAEKDEIKKLETHLKNYTTYKVAISMIESLGEELDRLSSVKVLKLYEEWLHYHIIVTSIEEAIAELDETESQFVTSRYLKGKTIVQTSFDLGYSEKYVFNIRKITLKKLLISLRCLIYL